MYVKLEELLQGKSTMINNKIYLPTEAYVKPFIDKLKPFTEEFIIEVKTPNQITINYTEQPIKDVTFNRVLVQAVLKDDFVNYENHSEVIGLVYGLDIKQPVYKLYRGALNMACTNLCIFNPDFLNIQNINPEQELSVDPIDELLKKPLDIKVRLDLLKNTVFDINDEHINYVLGDWIRNSLNMHYPTEYGKVKFAANTIIAAYKDLFENKESKYYVGDKLQTDMFNIYNSFTYQITKDSKDVFNRAEKTLLLQNILHI